MGGSHSTATCWLGPPQLPSGSDPTRGSALSENGAQEDEIHHVDLVLLSRELVIGRDVVADESQANDFDLDSCLLQAFAPDRVGQSLPMLLAATREVEPMAAVDL